MKRLIITFLMSMIVLISFAQEEFILKKDLSIINVGDGKYLFRMIDADKTPLNGRHKIIDGRKSEYVVADFTNGYYNGDYAFYKFNKLAEKGTYKDGLKEQIYTQYYSDGITPEKEIPYCEGKLNGMARYYYTNGKPEREKSYTMGVEDGIDRKYDPDNGNITTNLFFKNGVPDGPQVMLLFSNIGVYKEYATYSNGVRVGMFTQIFEDERLKTLGSYNEQGQKDGNWYERDSFSEREKYSTGRHIIYENGKVVKQTNVKDFDKFCKKILKK